jgi:hypothetical protein
MEGKKIKICSYDCPHGEFPPEDSAGICRTMSGVYCIKLRRIVFKNAPCAWEIENKSKKSERHSDD